MCCTRPCTTIAASIGRFMLLRELAATCGLGLDAAAVALDALLSSHAICVHGERGWLDMLGALHGSGCMGNWHSIKGLVVIATAVLSLVSSARIGHGAVDVLEGGLCCRQEGLEGCNVFDVQLQGPAACPDKRSAPHGPHALARDCPEEAHPFNHALLYGRVPGGWL